MAVIIFQTDSCVVISNTSRPPYKRQPRVMSVDPTAIITLIEHCIKIYEYLKDVKESSHARSRFMRQVSAFKGVLHDLQDHLSELAQNQSLATCLARLLDPEGPLFTAIQRTLQDLEEKLARGVVHEKGLKAKLVKTKDALLWPLTRSEVETLLGDIERYKTSISLTMEQDASVLEREMHKMVSDVASEVVSMKENVNVIGVTISADERHKVAEWLSNLTSFSAFHAENSQKWLPGTATWVLESPEFQQWENKESSSSTLWCYGDAGAGKSVISAMIVEHLRKDPNSIVLVIVCRYSQNRKILTSDTHTVMCSLLAQLLQLEAASNIPPALLDLFRRKTYPSTHFVCTALIQAAALISRPIYIVLDALDECPLGFNLVAAIHRLGNDFNLLVTSRHRSPQRHDFPSICIRAKDNDILAVINDKIPVLPHVREDEDLQVAVRREVVAKANGMFLLASLKLRELEHDVTSKADIREVLAGIPASLDDAYSQIFERISNQGPRKKELALHTIMWIYTEAEHHLCVNFSVLNFLLACKISTSGAEFLPDRGPRSRSDIMNICNGLLTTSREDQERFCTEEYSEFSFIHYSVHEYITRCQPSPFSEHPYEFVFNTCTIALRHVKRLESLDSCNDVLRIWLRLARIMDAERPDFVQSVLEDPNFAQSAVPFGETKYTEITDAAHGGMTLSPRSKTLFLEVDGNLTTLEYAAAFGLPRTFRLAKETKHFDEPQRRSRAMALLVTNNRWELVEELCAPGEYDVNAYCDYIGSTPICELLSSADSEALDNGRNSKPELRQKFLQHPGTSLYCPRHDSLIGCTIHRGRERFHDSRPADIAVILERLDTKDGRPWISGVYAITTSHPPNIYHVIAMLLQRFDVDLEAPITRMVPPEILLTLLMLPWDRDDFSVDEEAVSVLRPYARRPADVPNIATSDDVPNGHVVPDAVPAEA